jgi:cholesterol oxidase
MGRDSVDGVIKLLPSTHDVRVTWNIKGNLPLYDTEQQLCEDVTGRAGRQRRGEPAGRR